MSTNLPRVTQLVSHKNGPSHQTRPSWWELGEANDFAPTGTRHVMHPECYELCGTFCQSPSKAPEGRGSSLAYPSGLQTLSQHALGSWQAFEQDWAVQNTRASRGPTQSTGFTVAADGCLGTTDGTRVPLLSPSQKDVFFINSPSSLASFPHTDSDLHRRPPPRADALSTYLSLISILAKDKNHRGAREQGDN